MKNTDIYMITSSKIKEIRLKSGYTQQNIADRLRLTRSSYTYWETGKTKITIGQLYDFLSIFQISLSEFFDFKLDNQGDLKKRTSRKNSIDVNKISDLSSQEKKQLLC